MTAFGAQGTVLKQGTNTIAQVSSITGPTASKDVVDTSHLTTTSRNRTFISTLRDEGEFEVEVLWDPTDTTQELIETAYEADAPTTYSIVWSDNTTWSFSAHTVSPINPSAPLGEALRGSFRLKVTAGVTRD